MATVSIPARSATTLTTWWSRYGATTIKYRDNALILKNFQSGSVYMGLNCSLVKEAGYYRLSPGYVRCYVTRSNVDSSSTYAYIKINRVN